MISIIINKELKSMFASPLAWVLMAFLQGIFAFIFMSQIQNFSMMQAQLASAPNAPGLTEIAVTPVFSIAAIVLLFSVPLLTMRLIAEQITKAEFILEDRKGGGKNYFIEGIFL